MWLLLLCLSLPAASTEPPTPPSTLQRVAKAIGDQARAFVAWLYSDESRGSINKVKGRDPFLQPYPDACAVGTPPELSWRPFPSASDGCAEVTLRNRRADRTHTLACPPGRQGRFTLKPPALEPGRWDLQVRSSEGERKSISFVVGPLGPMDASPCDPQDNGPAVACPSELSAEEQVLCEALMLTLQRRFWEVEALLTDAPAGSDAANLRDQLRVRYRRTALGAAQ
ncbi:MAG: hypothetical protein H6739_24960 [Alphaproteobacteria bacterium]|nr:hypothetical protein [Alphaproteobacteria bacterium]